MRIKKYSRWGDIRLFWNKNTKIIFPFLFVVTFVLIFIIWNQLGIRKLSLPSIWSISSEQVDSEIFLDTWNRWKENGDTRAKQLIIQNLQSKNLAKDKEIYEFIRKNLTPQVKIDDKSTRTKDIKPEQEILTNEQVKSVKELLLYSFQNRTNDTEIQKDIKFLHICKGNAAASPSQYKQCIDEIK